jgi:hypothetical protein
MSSNVVALLPDGGKPPVSEEAKLWRLKFDIVAAVGEGISDDAKFLPAHLMKKVFLYPGIAKTYVDCLVKKFANPSRYPDIVVGYGAVGPEFALLMAQAFQALSKEPNAVASLAFEEIGPERYEVGFPGSEAKKILRGKRVLLVTPLLSPDIWPQIDACIVALKSAWNVGTISAIAAIAQCGDKPPEILLDSNVIPLVHIS